MEVGRCDDPLWKSSPTRRTPRPGSFLTWVLMGPPLLGSPDGSEAPSARTEDGEGCGRGLRRVLAVCCALCPSRGCQRPRRWATRWLSCAHVAGGLILSLPSGQREAPESHHLRLEGGSRRSRLCRPSGRCSVAAFQDRRACSRVALIADLRREQDI